MERRMILIRLLLYCVVATSVMLAGCGDEKRNEEAAARPPEPIRERQEEQGGAEARRPAAIRITPGEIVLSPHAKQRTVMLQNIVRISALDADQKELPLTAFEESIRFSSSSDAVSIDSTGQLTLSASAKTGDAAVIRIEADGLSAELTVHVRYGLSDTIVTGAGGDAIVTNTADLAVLVNKRRNLPADYVPSDLVQPDVPFSFEGESEKNGFARKPPPRWSSFLRKRRKTASSLSPYRAIAPMQRKKRYLTETSSARGWKRQISTARFRDKANIKPGLRSTFQAAAPPSRWNRSSEKPKRGNGLTNTLMNSVSSSVTRKGRKRLPVIFSSHGIYVM